MKRQTAFFGFNRGIISPLALARVDMKRVALSAEEMENWMPRVLGSMMLRPGREYIGETKSSNQARFIPFIFSTTDTALIELTNTVMRIWIDNALVTRVAVTTTVTNGLFTTDVVGWTDSDEAGGTSAWSATYSGSMELLGDGTNAAQMDQQITVAAGDQNKEHALRIVIPRGPVTVLVGSTQGGNEYIESVLDTGDHSLTLTPTGNFWIRFRNSLSIRKYVGECTVEAAGVLELPTPWATSDLQSVRYDQSGDIIFVAVRSFLQRAIERRSATSWSLVRYLVDNGPYDLENTSDIKITPSALTGNITLTASRPLFDPGHVDSGLFTILSTVASGVCRVTAYSTKTSVSAEVLSSFASTLSSSRWKENLWNGVNGFPSAGAFYEGRLWWTGKNGIWGSVSDDYYNFDENTVGDSGPINRTVGSGPVDNINWILPLQRLILGADGDEWSARASSFDEILTPSNFNIKRASSQGSDSVIAAHIDSRGVFVQRSGTRLFELAIDSEVGDYQATELTLVSPEVGNPSITHVAIQRLPDTRVHCVRSDGKVAVMIYNSAENVTCWVLVSSPNAVIEDVVVLPGDVEDTVYYVVRRTINAVTKRYLELWALETECIGGADNFLVDAFTVYDGAATTTITGLGYLEGQTVSIWGNSKDLGTKIVSGGQITTIPEAVTHAVVGIAYTARWKSTKLSYLAQGEPMSMAQPKRIVHLGLILSNAYYQAIQYGPDFDTLDVMPAVEDGKEIAQDTLNASYDADLFEFPGGWDTDSRLCITAASPRPVTVLAAVVSYDSQEKS